MGSHSLNITVFSMSFFCLSGLCLLAFSDMLVNRKNYLLKIISNFFEGRSLPPQCCAGPKSQRAATPLHSMVTIQMKILREKKVIYKYP